MYHHKALAKTSQGNFVTDWINLTEGKFYKLRGQHIDYGGGMWSQVAVEFEKQGSEAHPMAAKAVQSWRIEQDNVAETWTLVVNNPSTGKYKIGLKSPLETTSWLSDEITSNGDAGHVRSKLYGFFSAKTRTESDIEVTLVMYDAAGVIVTSSAAANKFIYTI